MLRSVWVVLKKTPLTAFCEAKILRRRQFILGVQISFRILIMLSMNPFAYKHCSFGNVAGSFFRTSRRSPSRGVLNEAVGWNFAVRVKRKNVEQVGFWPFEKIHPSVRSGQVGLRPIFCSTREPAPGLGGRVQPANGRGRVSNSISRKK